MIQITKSPFKFTPAENPIIFTVTNSSDIINATCMEHQIKDFTIGNGNTGSQFKYRRCDNNQEVFDSIPPGGVKLVCARPGSVQNLEGIVQITTGTSCNIINSVVTCKDYEVENQVSGGGSTGSTFSYITCNTNQRINQNVTGSVFVCARPGSIQLVSGNITTSTFDENCGTVPPPPPITPIYFKTELYEAGTNTLVYTGKLFPTPQSPSVASINLSQQLQALVRSDIDNNDVFLVGKPNNYISYKVKFIPFGFTSTTANTITELSSGVTTDTLYTWDAKLDVFNYTNDWDGDKYVLQTGEEDKKFLTYYPREEEKCVNQYSNEQLYFIQDLGTGVTTFQTAIWIESSGNTTILDFSGSCIGFGDNLTLLYRNSCEGSSPTPILTAATYTCEGGGAPPEYLAAVFEAQIEEATIFPGATVTRQGTKVIIVRDASPLSSFSCPVEFFGVYNTVNPNPIPNGGIQNINFATNSEFIDNCVRHNLPPIIPFYDFDLPGGGSPYDVNPNWFIVNPSFTSNLCPEFGIDPETGDDLFREYWRQFPKGIIIAFKLKEDGEPFTYNYTDWFNETYTAHTLPFFYDIVLEDYDVDAIDPQFTGGLFFELDFEDNPNTNPLFETIGSFRIPTNRKYIEYIVNTFNSGNVNPGNFSGNFFFRARKTTNKTFELIMAPGTGSILNGYEFEMTREVEGCPVCTSIGGEIICDETNFIEQHKTEITCGVTLSEDPNQIQVSRTIVREYDPYGEFYITDEQASFIWNNYTDDDSFKISFGLNYDRNKSPFFNNENEIGIKKKDLNDLFFSVTSFNPETGRGLCEGLIWMFNNWEYKPKTFIPFSFNNVDFSDYDISKGWGLRRPSDGLIRGYEADLIIEAEVADGVRIYAPLGTAFLLTGTTGVGFVAFQVGNDVISGVTIFPNSNTISNPDWCRPLENEPIPCTQEIITKGQIYQSTTWSSTTVNSNFIVTFATPEIRASATLTITGTSAVGDNVCFYPSNSGGTVIDTVWCYYNGDSGYTTTDIAREMVNTVSGVFTNFDYIWNGNNTITILAPAGLGQAGNSLIFSGVQDTFIQTNTLPASSSTATITGILPAFAPGQSSFVEVIDYELGSLVLANYTTLSGDVSSVSTYVSNLVSAVNTNPYGYTASQISSNQISFTARTGTGAFQNNFFIEIQDGNGSNGGQFLGGTNSGSTSYDKIKYSVTNFTGGVNPNPNATGFTTDKVLKLNTSPSLLEEQFGFNFQKGDKIRVQLADTIDNSPLTEVFTYTYCGEKCNVDYVNILWRNSLGGVDSHSFVAPQEEVQSDKLSILKNNINLESTTPYITNGRYNKAQEVYSNKNKSSFRVYTQPLSDAEVDWMTELLISPEIYVELSNEQIVPIKLLDTNYQLRKKKYVNNDLIQFQFTFQFDENYIHPLSQNGKIIINN